MFASKRKRRRQINAAQAVARGGRRKRKRNCGVRAVSLVLPAAGWQRLNDLPNNKSSRRYDRTRTEPGNERTAHLDIAAESNGFSFRLFYIAMMHLRRRPGRDLHHHSFKRDCHILRIYGPALLHSFEH